MRASELSERKRRLRWLLQCFFMFLTMAAFLFIADEDLHRTAVVSVVGATSLGSTAFLAFVAHRSYMAHSRRIISSYLIAIVIGIAFYHFVVEIRLLYLPISAHHLIFICAAASAAIAMLAMTLLRVEHAPAAGLALGLVMRYWDLHMLMSLMIFVILIAVIKYWLRDWLVTID